MQLNWYRCNLVKPITCMAAIVFPYMTCLYALLWLYAIYPVALALLLPLF